LFSLQNNNEITKFMNNAVKKKYTDTHKHTWTKTYTTTHTHKIPFSQWKINTIFALTFRYLPLKSSYFGPSKVHGPAEAT
jgi:hypothetical protein